MPAADKVEPRTPGKFLKDKTPAAKLPSEKNARKNISNGLHGKTKAKRLNRAFNAQRAVNLRLHGMTYQQIADAIGMSYCSVRDMVEKALRDLVDVTLQDTEQMRALEAARLDSYLVSLQPCINVLAKVTGEEKRTHGGPGAPRVMAGLKALEIALKVQERRAKLYGIDVKTATNDLADAIKDLLLGNQRSAAQGETVDLQLVHDDDSEAVPVFDITNLLKEGQHARAE